MAIKIPTTADAEKALSKIEFNFPEVYVIQSSEQFVEAGETLKGVKQQQHQLDALRKTMTRPLDEAKRAILALFEPRVGQLDRIEKALKAAVAKYTREREEARRLEEARLREQQRKEAERLEARAEAARAKGQEEKAEALLDRIPSVPIVLVDTEKVAGISMRMLWQAEVVNLRELAAFVAESGSTAYITPDLAALGATARSTEGLAKVPGVLFYETPSVGVRG